ncbi:hypothetical protein ASJ82_07990 [Methanosphaera cuniculi]|uniref:Uncharacterized protein n=2 Tax=Methanosphaera cuniculi TaxID=1077256 RepID=A0A2A2HE72_9EURY|nr:hypothetical protein ASJ82_07990 [Methanosphaera cuniculi]
MKEIQMRKKINKNYPILFNRINWQILEENMEELFEFQKQHDDILIPENFRPFNVENDPEGIYEKYVKKIIKTIMQTCRKKWGPYRRDPKSNTYDDVYEFLQKYPEWEKLVYYDENLNDIYDEYLTIRIDKTLPVKFNRINWKKVDEKIDRIYEIFINQKEKITVPDILFIDYRELKEVSNHYKTISQEIWEYYFNERFEKKNPVLHEYGWNNSGFRNYDGFYYFIKDYPELGDIVYFDPDKE